MTILLIEDDARLADLIIRAFPRDEILIAKTLSAAKEALEGIKPNVMLVDLALPDGEGIDTIRALSQYQIPKVVLTSNQTGVAPEARALGVIDYVRKNGAIKDVLARISFNLDQYRPKPRFRPETFSQIQACLCKARELVA